MIKTTGIKYQSIPQLLLKNKASNNDEVVFKKISSNDPNAGI